MTGCCEGCHGPFTVRHPNQRFCTHKCNDRTKMRRYQLRCKEALAVVEYMQTYTPNSLAKIKQRISETSMS